MAGWLIGAGLPAWFYATQVEPLATEVTQVRLVLPRLGREFSGFRLVQLSDLHVGGWMTPERLEAAVTTVLELAPEAVAITGDFVHGYDRKVINRALVEMRAPLRRLTQALPVFAVLGNHDRWLEAQAVRSMLREVGMVELRNSFQTLRRGADQLHLCGVDDVKEGWARLGALTRLLPAAGCAILLAHEPDLAEKTAKRQRFDLQISGHSHGGQVVLPGIGPVILPYLARKYPLGLYQIGNLFQYTNRGLGMAALNLRFNCRPEITVFTLESA